MTNTVHFDGKAALVPPKVIKAGQFNTLEELKPLIEAQDFPYILVSQPAFNKIVKLLGGK